MFLFCFEYLIHYKFSSDYFLGIPLFENILDKYNKSKPTKPTSENLLIKYKKNIETINQESRHPLDEISNRNFDFMISCSTQVENDLIPNDDFQQIFDESNKIIDDVSPARDDLNLIPNEYQDSNIEDLLSNKTCLSDLKREENWIVKAICARIKVYI